LEGRRFSRFSADCVYLSTPSDEILIFIVFLSTLFIHNTHAFLFFSFSQTRTLNKKKKVPCGSSKMPKASNDMKGEGQITELPLF
jgi:hypothetical protein